MVTEEADKKEDDQRAAGWEYRSVAGEAEMPAEHDDAAPDSNGPDSDAVEWTASEYVAHDKGVGWYIALIIVAAAVVGVIYLATRDVFSVIVVVIMATIFAVSGSHKPRTVTYRVDGSGLTVGNKFYPYAAYKSFSVPQDGPFTTISFMPMKHLAFPVGAYLSPDSQNEVIGMISSHLPLEHGETTVVDHLMHHMRF